jgi:hypothetical protein
MLGKLSIITFVQKPVLQAGFLFKSGVLNLAS